MRRFPFRALPLTAAVVSIALCGVALARPLDAPASAESDAPRVVEVVRYATRGEYTVEQRLWIDLDRAPDAEAAADRAMGVAQGEATVTAQYKIGKHKWAPGSLPLQVSYNSAGAGANPPAIEAIQNAVEQWNAVTPATFSFAFGGTNSRGTGACSESIEADGFNTIQYSTGLSAGVLGRTCTLFKSSGSPILEFDMELDAGTGWSIAATTPRGSYDLASTILHELGHAAGISHPCDSASGCTAAEKLSVMFPYLNDGDQRRSLTDDDKNALRAQYPGGPAPTPVPTPVVIPPYNREFSAIMVSLARD
ncbi:MAG: matrixin family metalloprotease [Tepidiformaceae bacterium]